ncbi:FAS-associated death domain protein [Rhinophrynus dorsalis]
MGDFNVMLLGISGKLDEQELYDLKFICQEKISKRKRENIKSAIDLFSYLIELTEISSDKLDFLIYLFTTIKRNDLVQEVKDFKRTGRVDMGQDEAEERDLLDEVFDFLSDNIARDWKMFVRRLGVSDTVIECAMHANPYNMQEQHMQCLRQWRKKKGDNADVSHILKTLLQCNMRLIHDKIVDRFNISVDTSSN